MDLSDRKAYYQGAAVRTQLNDDLEGLWSDLTQGKSCLKPYQKSELGINTYANQLTVQKVLNKELEDIINKYIQNKKINIHSDKFRLYLSTTKGNMAEASTQVPLMSEQIQYLQYKFGLIHRPKLISHACVSGTLAIKEASESIEMGRYDEVLILGYDPLCDFVLSGFQSFMALAPNLCQPYDQFRKGINIGEVLVLMHLSHKQEGAQFFYNGGGDVNDANHISGPSRNGEGLHRSIEQALSKSSINRGDIDYINAHGTATLFNDDMESHALHRSGLDQVPLNSLKSYFGHTLGAAGLIESVIGLKELEEGVLLSNSLHKEQSYQLPFALNIVQETKEYGLNHMLKCSSGFGGCNAVIIFSKA